MPLLLQLKFSHNDRMAEVRGTSRGQLVQPTAQEGPPRVRCPEACPDGFWIYPRMDTSQILWVHVCLVLGSPELDPALQVWPHQCWAGGKDHLPRPATVLLMQPRAHCWFVFNLGVHQEPQVLFCKDKSESLKSLSLNIQNLFLKRTFRTIVLCLAKTSHKEQIHKPNVYLTGRNLKHCHSRQTIWNYLV